MLVLGNGSREEAQGTVRQTELFYEYNLEKSMTSQLRALSVCCDLVKSQELRDVRHVEVKA